MSLWRGPAQLPLQNNPGCEKQRNTLANTLAYTFGLFGARRYCVDRCHLKVEVEPGPENKLAGHPVHLTDSSEITRRYRGTT